MKFIKAYINESIENTGLFIRSNFLYISFIAILGFPSFYFVWKYLFPQPYESLGLRLTFAVLYLPLIVNRYWPSRIAIHFKYYASMLMVSTVAFFFFMLIKNEHSEIWTLSTISGIALIIILTYEWLMAFIYFILGVSIACVFAVITPGNDLVLIKYEHIPIYLFILIGGSLFNHRNIILQEKYNLLKAIGSSISNDMDTPLVKVKTVIEELADNMSISKNYVQKEVLGILTEKLQQTNEDLNRVQSELVKSEKMAALGRAVGRIAHELNTPIGAARIAAENIIDETKLLLEELDTTDNKKLKPLVMQYQHDMHRMEDVLFESVNRAANLISNFKQISNDQINIQKKEFQLLQYIERSIRMLENPLKRQHIRVHFHGEEVTICSDASLFHQIIENLTTNVLKYAYDEKGGRVDITLESTKDAIILLFADYGKGIAKEHLPKIFDAFYTTGGGKGGTGLGLDIVYRIVTNQLKGTITCKSTVGQGTMFVINIPKTSIIQP